MSSATLSDGQSWFTTFRFQVGALWILAALAVAQGVVGIGLRDNDFLWHRNHGNYFLVGRVDKDHYLPARGLMDAALTFAPYRVTRAVVYVVSLLLLFVCNGLWNQMAAPAPPAVARAAGFFAVILFLPYLLRDLDECGLQIYLLFFLTMAGFALSRGRPAQTGFWLATAVCYKATPLLFLPMLLWKRQWRAALWMIVCLALWCLVPALYSGWDENLRAHERWLAESARLKAAQQAYPSLLEREPPKIYNLSFQAAIARYLETYPPGHPLHIDHPLFAQFGDLPPVTAYNVSHAVLAVLGFGYLWFTRRPWTGERGGSAMAGEWATLCALCALLSPLCWKHHFILLLPCAFLQVRGALAGSLPGRSSAMLFGALAAVAYGCRPFLVGDTWAALLLSYKVDTVAMVVLATWTLWPRRREDIVAATSFSVPMAVLSKAA